ncbi:sugar ABC transporter ATP-binding protein [Mesorhizobium ventifaucium]|uniref:Ribose import ATP-binding protein RbsA n=1 Tax=Mesorhizobium ventifaucium TaxID=666020 RepID=A0ABN8JEJ7_9HYPH|nr:sugar ABC transporter ATP-binding protein [Mesorhizobium ventifaucium]CAH2396548.1 Ribose import ATP-binding protein RbsA [Mesorhizobium ventifaucium]
MEIGRNTTSGSSPIVSFRGVTKKFGGTVAVNNVSFDVERGSILALLGENGAGKSTLIKVLAGIHRPDAGEILVNGRQLDGNAESHPISFIHQDLGLIEWMTVAENMAMATGFPRRWGLIDWNEVERSAAEALKVVGGGIDPRQRVFRLSRAEKSLLTIARALAVDAELLVLDEPTASLPEEDVARLFEVLERLRKRGVAIIYVSHRLDEVYRLADRVVVMRDGKLVGDRPVSETSAQDLVLMIVGRPPSEVFSKAPPPEAGPVLVLRSLSAGEVGPVSLEVRAGEMVALAGLRGAGQELIGRVLFGLEPVVDGSMHLNGRSLTPRSPRDAMATGVGFVSGNRQEESLAMSNSIRENLMINPGMRGRKPLRLMSNAAERRQARDLAGRFSVRPNDPELSINSLSGGNQQKVVLARWLDYGGQLLILEDPTQGVDVGAKAEIYGLLNQALERGAAILMISADFEEVANVCNRAFVFNRGRVATELAREQLSMETLIHAASGLSRRSKHEFEVIT